MIFNEWIPISEDWMPPYGKSYMLLIEDEQGLDDSCQQVTLGYRLHTDQKGECFQLITGDMLYNKPGKQWNDNQEMIYRFVTHVMETPASVTLPERTSKNKTLKDLAMMKGSWSRDK